MNQLGYMRKYIGSHTASVIYKQMILSLSDYADVMIKSGPPNDIRRIGKLHEKAIKIIDNKQHPRANMDNLRAIYRIPPIEAQQDEHMCSMMYRLSENPEMLQLTRPRVHLRSRGKIEFKTYKRTYKSPGARDIIVGSLARASSKVYN